MKHLGPGRIPDGGEQRETTPDLDVWEQTFTPAGTLIVAGSRKGAPALFLVHPGAEPTISLLPLPQAARYPALSPDGKWLSFSHLEGGVWHLWLADVHTWSVRRLTSGSVHYRIEWPGLSAEEKQAGYILPCVAYPLSDVVIAPAD